ncbi:hypothetical protein HQ585_03185 [candidate division KSB1 bacterium]|nr:hypothetical protein [candidate division KSB1 bacterium]
MPAGEHQVEWNVTGLSSGIYYYRLEVGDPSTGSPSKTTGQAGQSFIQTRKMIVMK